MIIANCGYGFSGAGAIFDFLKGYDDISHSPDGMEFDIIHQPDGINDLKYFLCVNKERIACNSAIKRFRRIMENGFWAMQMKRIVGSEFISLTENFIESLVQIQWYGRSIFDPSDVSSTSSNPFIYKVCSKIESYLSRIKGKNIHFPSDKLRYFSIMDEEKFNYLTKQYLNGILQLLKLNKKHILLDMLFSVTNPNMGREFFEDVKTIVVDRDPRCMYLNVLKNYGLSTFMPYDNVNDFIKYYKILKEKETKCNDVLYINYDKLIYEYIPTTQKIINYLGFDRRPENEFKFFNPNVSVKYTYPLNSNNKKEDIKTIEKELSDYLYDFPKFVSI